MYNKKLKQLPAIIREVSLNNKNTEEEYLTIECLSNKEGCNIHCLEMKEYLPILMKELFNSFNIKIDANMTLEENFKKLEGLIVMASNYKLATVSIALDNEREFDFVKFYNKHNLTLQAKDITSLGLEPTEELKEIEVENIR